VYFSINNTSVSSVPNASFSYGGRNYKTNDDAKVYCTSGKGLVSFGNYSLYLTGINDNSTQAKDMIILRRNEWVSGTSNWRYYDFWGLTNTNTDSKENSFLVDEHPLSLYSITLDSENKHTMNNVTRVINKIGENAPNATITDHPFVFNVTNDSSYRFWVGTDTHTTIPNNYIYDTVEEHIIWPEYNAIFTGDDYSSGNVGVDINNVGTYVVNGKKVDVNLRVTFYWQPSPVSLQYSIPGIDHKTENSRTFSFNQFPRFVGFKLSKSGHRLGLPTTGTPYRAKIDFFYADGEGEHTLAINGSFGFEDIDGFNYIGIKANDGATIDEIQCIDNNYSWEDGDFKGEGSIDCISLGLNANDNSGVYDVIGTNLYINSTNVQTTTNSQFLSNHPNYYSFTSNNGPESRVIYKISNLSTLDAIVGGYGQHEYGRRYFNTIFDKPSIFTQVYATENNIYTKYALNYAKADSERDLTTNGFPSMGFINISGVHLGRNEIPKPTVMLKDINDDESESIVINRDQNGVLNPYTEVIRVKIPYEEKYMRGTHTYDNYYDYFKIEQVLENGITPDLANINIHYLGDTTNLTSTYFTTTYTSTTHKIEIVANSNEDNSIYKQPDFYECDLVVEIPLAITAQYSDNVWNCNVKEFSHTVSVYVERDNSDFAGVDNESVTQTSDRSIIAKVYVVNVGLKKDNIKWEVSDNSATDMMNVALYANNVEEYSFGDGVAIDNNSAIRWVGVEDKTYNIYASKNSNEKTTLVDTGLTVTPNNTQ